MVCFQTLSLVLSLVSGWWDGCSGDLSALAVSEKRCSSDITSRCVEGSALNLSLWSGMYVKQQCELRNILERLVRALPAWLNPGRFNRLQIPLIKNMMGLRALCASRLDKCSRSQILPHRRAKTPLCFLRRPRYPCGSSCWFLFLAHTSHCAMRDGPDSFDSE